MITDDLGMKAVADRFTPEEILRRGLEAGVDLFLQCGDKGEGVALADTLGRMLAERRLDAGRVARSAERIRIFREGLR